MNKKRYNHGYEIYKKYKINEIFNIIEEKDTIPDSIIYSKKDFQDSKSRIKIIKNLIDRDGCECKRCKEIPSYFGLGKDNAGYWHLDLYSNKDDEHYMYTIDHVHPKSKGGKNHIDNYQLLCKICNEDKSDIVDGEENKIIKKTKAFNYINKKLVSLHQQTKGILNKIKNHKVVCVKRKKGFTIGNSYPILDIKVKVDKDFNSYYKFYTVNDNGRRVLTNFSYFLTVKDSEYYINNRFSK